MFLININNVAIIGLFWGLMGVGRLVWALFTDRLRYLKPFIKKMLEQFTQESVGGGNTDEGALNNKSLSIY